MLLMFPVTHTRFSAPVQLLFLILLFSALDSTSAPVTRIELLLQLNVSEIWMWSLTHSERQTWKITDFKIPIFLWLNKYPSKQSQCKNCLKPRECLELWSAGRLPISEEKLLKSWRKVGPLTQFLFSWSNSCMLCTTTTSEVLISL